ncbi:MAG: hypothetical protein K6F82_06225 [Sphaerochaetaceae bacterium]|nr:hypothetical protein [Sphaerochaetaceae bacterium]
MSIVSIIELTFVIICLLILLIGTFHSARKAGDSLKKDKLPPNSYPSSYFTSSVVEDDPDYYDVEAPDSIDEDEDEELSLHDSE